MAKRFTFMMIMILIFGSVSFSQTTATLQPVSNANPGESVLVPLNVQNFTNVGAITFFIRFNPAILNFIELTSFPAGMIAGTPNDSTLALTWSSVTPVTPATGTLLNIRFMYNGPGSSNVNFLTAQCEVGNIAGVPVPVAYTNGSVTANAGNVQTATLESQTGVPGTTVDVPIKFAGFGSNIGAITQKIQYNAANLTFIGLTAGSMSGAIASAANGIVTIVWSSTSGASINFPANVIGLKFLYTGSTSTPVSFAPGCVISTITGTNVPVSYVNGAVNPGVITASAVIESKTGAIQGTDYELALTLNNFPLTPGAPAAITLNIGFSNPTLSFLGISNAAFGAQTIVNQVGSMITIVYTNVAAPTVNGDFLKLKFKYNGPGTGNIFFAAGCEFATLGNVIIPSSYSDATVAPGTPDGTGTISFVQGTVGATVSVPVKFANLPVNMGAATLYIDYDNTKLTYVDVQNNTYGAIVNHDPIIANRINIAWNGSSATNICVGNFLELRFIYAGGATSDCGAPVNFAAGCELADFTGALIPATWVNGGINLRFKISGYLTYDKTPVLPLAGYNIYVMDGPQPLPPAVTPVPNMLWFVTTDVTGYFEIFVPNGDYYLYGSSSVVWQDVDLGDVIQLQRYQANLSNTIGSDVLRQHAADINQDSFIDGGDIIPLQRRIANLTPNPNYLAPDWLFGNPHVVVNCTDVANQNFMGILSGEVDGSFDPTN